MSIWDLLLYDGLIGSPVGAAAIYGVSWDGGSNPALTRTDDAVGMVAAAGVDSTPVVNDFDDAEIYRDITEVTDALGNVFVRIPRFYIRKTKVGVARTWQISRQPFEGAYLPWCFWDFTNSRALPYVDVGKYLATLDGSSRLESKAGGYPLISKNIVEMRGYAQANGAGYQQLDIHVVDVLRTLFYVEFATLHSQSVMAGFTTGQYNAAHTATVAESGVNRIIVANATAALFEVGQAISLGTSLGGNQIAYGRTITSKTVYDASNTAINFDGATVNIAIGNIVYNTGYQNIDGVAATSGSAVSNSTGKHYCKYREIVSPWGNVWQFVDGININDWQGWACPDADDYASNLFASPYVQLGYGNHNASGYASEMGHDSARPYAEFPVAVGGGSTTYYADYYYQSSGSIALLGGDWGSGSRAGLSCWNLSIASSYASVLISARLLKKAL